MPDYNTFTYGENDFSGVGGGFSSGTGSYNNPVDIGGATIKPKTTKPGFDIVGLLSSGAGLITAVGNLFGETRTNPVIVAPGSSSGNNQPQKDNTMLYILGGAAVIIALILIMKKK